MNRAPFAPRNGNRVSCLPTQVSPQDKDLGSDPHRAYFPAQTPDIEDLEVSSKSHVKVGLNQTGLPALVKDVLGKPALTPVVRPALHTAPRTVGETTVLSDVSGANQHADSSGAYHGYGDT